METISLTAEQLFRLAQQKTWIDSIPIIFTAFASLLSAFGAFWVAIQQKHIRHSVNSLLDKRVLDAEEKGRAGERERADAVAIAKLESDK